ncbi:MAG: cytochrome c1 [Castellaniella sp.]|uniref:cytochrome c1 n=1 Tax=Castellaniella sp. TaxID=1955812 RepID=UPI002A359A8A|nr:cytochrome c1 [Castellaniella sp.]MDY0309034.1 cytochrome c1 [Castellaniella sp.]
MLKKLLGVLALSLTCTLTFAAEGGVHLDRAPDRITDLAALQNGAKLFVNYCLNCHSANSMRYNKLMDLGLSEDDIKKNLLFTSEKVGDLMTISMTPEDAKKWFGAAPPDLSVIARAKNTSFGPSGVDYIYTYLRTFYRDTTKKTGWNNVVFPSVGMPNALWELEGPRSFTDIEVHQVTDDQGNAHWERTTTVYDAAGIPTVKTETLQDYTGEATRVTRFESADPKAFSKFESDVADLSNFLGWMAEPGQLVRKQIGVWVMLFLFLFLFVAIRMNAAYWKHVR